MMRKKKLEQLEARVQAVFTHDMIASSLTIGALARCLSLQPGIDAQKLIDDLREHSAYLLAEISENLPANISHVYLSRLESLINHLKTGASHDRASAASSANGH